MAAAMPLIRWVMWAMVARTSCSAAAHKPPGRDFEVYNDFNSLLANLYRCVRDKPDLLMNALKYVLSPGGRTAG